MILILVCMNPYGYDNSESDYDDSDSNYCNEDESDVETSEEEELGTMPDIHGIIEKYNLQELQEVLMSGIRRCKG